MTLLRRALVTAPLQAGTPVWFCVDSPLADDSAKVAQRGYVIAVEPALDSIVVRRCDHPRQHRLPRAHVEVRLTHDAEPSDDLLKRAAAADPGWGGDATALGDRLENAATVASAAAVDQHVVSLAARTHNLGEVACNYYYDPVDRATLDRAVKPLLQDKCIGLACAEMFRETLARNVLSQWEQRRPPAAGARREQRAEIGAQLFASGATERAYAALPREQRWSVRLMGTLHGATCGAGGRVNKCRMFVTKEFVRLRCAGAPSPSSSRSWLLQFLL